MWKTLGLIWSPEKAMTNSNKKTSKIYSIKKKSSELKAKCYETGDWMVTWCQGTATSIAHLCLYYSPFGTSTQPRSLWLSHTPSTDLPSPPGWMDSSLYAYCLDFFFVTIASSLNSTYFCPLARPRLSEDMSELLLLSPLSSVQCLAWNGDLIFF